MEPDRFDALTRTLGDGSRRRLLIAVSGATVGALDLLRDRASTKAKNKKDKDKKPTKKKGKNCRANRKYCAGLCNEGPCDACCSNACGFTSDIPDLVCCVAVGRPCPSECKKNKPCPGCCGSSLCVSDGTCF